jgi:hypothetical protein
MWTARLATFVVSCVRVFVLVPVYVWLGFVIGFLLMFLLELFFGAVVILVVGFMLKILAVGLGGRQSCVFLVLAWVGLHLLSLLALVLGSSEGLPYYLVMVAAVFAAYVDTSRWCWSYCSSM